ADVERTPLVAPRGVVTTGKALASQEAKPTVRLFVSYARDDRDLCLDLTERLKRLLGLSKHFAYVCWDDRDILAGERWDPRIWNELDACDFGLLMVSSSFLNSGYIRE